MNLGKIKAQLWYFKQFYSLEGLFKEDRIPNKITCWIENSSAYEQTFKQSKQNIPLYKIFERTPTRPQKEYSVVARALQNPLQKCFSTMQSRVYKATWDAGFSSHGEQKY